MIRLARRRALAALLALCHLSLSLGGGTPAYAQAGDVEAPRIEFEPLDEGRRGDTQAFSATVTDDVGVARVALYYRLGTEGAFGPLSMTALSGTDVYVASLDDIAPDVTTIQYYIEARDASGNRSVEGFAFDPLERRLTEPATPIAEARTIPEEGAEGGLWTDRKVLYGVLGVVVLGALAAAAGGGGGGGESGDGPRADESDVPVRFVVDPIP